METKVITSVRRVSDIAREIRKEWVDPSAGALPFIESMCKMSSINDRVGPDSGASVVTYFLANAESWTGPAARRIKAELTHLVSA